MKLEYSLAPMLLGFVPGPMMEESLRWALLISRGDLLVFFKRPISLAFLISTVAIIIVMVASAVRKRRSDITD